MHVENQHHSVETVAPFYRRFHHQPWVLEQEAHHSRQSSGTPLLAWPSLAKEVFLFLKTPCPTVRDGAEFPLSLGVTQTLEILILWIVRSVVSKLEKEEIASMSRTLR